MRILYNSLSNSLKNLRLMAAIPLILGLTTSWCSGQASSSDDPVKWIPISNAIVKQLTDDGKKIGYPGGTAGVCVDRSNGDVYMIVPDQGVWKSSDRGASFARADGGALGGRCETGFSINPDPAGKRLAAFMLDGAATIMSGSGKIWKPLTPLGRGWDYGTANWSSPNPQTLLAVHHESGAELYLSADGGGAWKLLGKDYTAIGVFDDHTFVASKGSGILRTTDSGATWTSVSEATPTGRIVSVLNGKGYWVSKDGLLVSNDKGLTWNRQGSPIEAAWGPFFGKDPSHVVVVGRIDKVPGFFRSDDSGATWRLAAPFPLFEKESIPDWTPGKQWAAGWFCCFGWDPIGNIFYASRMGHPTLKYVGK